MNQINEKRQYPAIDIAKFIMAIMVVIIHRPLFNDNMVFTNFIIGKVICSIAVPFFFIVSSYFLFSKLNKSTEYSKTIVFEYEKRIFYIYVIWSIIYIPCIFVKNHTGHYDEITIKVLLSQCLFSIKEFFLSQSFVHLWFLNTLILSVAVAFFLIKKTSNEKVFVFSLVIFLLYYVLIGLSDSIDLVSNLIKYTPKILLNFARCGFICVSLGACLALKEINRNSKYKLNSLILFTSISFVLLIVSGALLFKNQSAIALNSLTKLLSIIVSFCIACICLRINLKESKVYRNLRETSILLYLSHLLVMSEGFKYLTSITGIAAFKENNLLKFFISLLFGLLFSITVILLKKHRRFRWLRYLC